MKTLIATLLKFFAWLAVILLIIYCTNQVLNYFWSPFKIHPDKHVVILGDSHMKYAFDDTLIPGIKNFANDADSYFYSYIKLREIHRNNRGIDTVVLGIANNSIDDQTQRLWILNESHMNQRLPLYLPLMKSDELWFVTQHFPILILKSLFTQVTFPKIFFNSNRSNYYGGYIPLNYSKVKTILQNRTRANKSNESSKFIYAEIELMYLRKIIDYCREHQMELVLFTTPLHPVIYPELSELNRYYQAKLTDVPLLDYSHLQLPDSCFADLVHLNHCGSKFFSKYIHQQRFNIR